MCIWKEIKRLELDSHTIKIYAPWRNALLVDFNLTLLITMFVNIMSFKLKIFGEITRGHRLRHFLTSLSSSFAQCTAYRVGGFNWTFPSFQVPLFQNGSKCKTFHVNMKSACSFIFMQIQTIFIRMVSHLDSPWNRGIRELGNGLLSTNLVKHLLLVFFFADLLYNNFHQRQKATNNRWNFPLRQLNTQEKSFDNSTNKIFIRVD